MSRRALPRIAQLTWVRNNASFNTIVARITDGPQSEMGRQVHVRVTPSDLPALKSLVSALEAKASDENGGN